MQNATAPGHFNRLGLLGFALMLLSACGSDHPSPASSDTGGGATLASTGGAASNTGGQSTALPSGGAPSGGSFASGGASSGGSPVSGGTSSGGSSAAGAASGGAPSSGGSAGNGGSGAASGSNGDSPPTHTFHIAASAGLHTHSFLPKTADPTVSATTFSGSGEQVAEVDNRAATMMAKLVVNLGGAGNAKADTTGVADFAVKRGFHVFAILYETDYNILINDADYYGDARREEWDGVDHTSRYATRDNQPSEKLGLSPADGVQQRLRLGLAYLAATFPDEEWGYYLAADGSIRWSDVIIAGVSHGASSSARFGMFVNASRILSFSGPRDDTCLEFACTEKSAVIATWFTETPVTPIDRFYAITGVKDSQHTQHLVAFDRLHYMGSVVEVDTQKPPYSNTRRLQSTSSGHSSFCDSASYKDACNYMLGVPTENLEGVN